MMDCQQINEMISGYLDGELSQGDRQRVELHVESCPRCRTTYEELAELRQAVGQLSFGEMSSAEWSKMMNDLTVRTSRRLGWLLHILGAVIVLVYAAYEFAVDDTVPALIKAGVAGLVVGLVLLFISVLRQRMLARQTDRYKDVQI